MIRIYILSSSSVFLSTPSARRATADAAIQSLGFQDFYPRPPRGGRPCMAALNDWLKGISIHALREEGDVQHHANVFDLAISIHALREEGDWHSATKGDASPHFYPRPPRGGRLNAALCHRQSHLISIHALREEGDILWHSGTKAGRDFYPRPPRGGRPALGHRHRRAAMISIHALREEGDWAGCPALWPSHDFYPRPPRGGRRSAISSQASSS